MTGSEGEKSNAVARRGWQTCTGPAKVSHCSGMLREEDVEIWERSSEVSFLRQRIKQRKNTPGLEYGQGVELIFHITA